MSLLLLFTGSRHGGHTYVEHPSAAEYRKRKKREQEYASQQLAEGRKRRAEEAAVREQKKLMDRVQAALNQRIAIDTGRENVAGASLELQAQQEQQEEEAVMLLLLS